MYGWCFVGEPAEMVALRIGVDLGLIKRDLTDCVGEISLVEDEVGRYISLSISSSTSSSSGSLPSGLSILTSSLNSSLRGVCNDFLKGKNELNIIYISTRTQNKHVDVSKVLLKS